MEEMIEKAKEELEILETLHPLQFDYIKLELQSFILSQQLLLTSLPCSSSATTQASTSMKRKRVISWKRRQLVEEESEINCDNHNIEKKKKKKKKRKERDRVDVVLAKAQACLRKIQDFKNSTSS